MNRLSKEISYLLRHTPIAQADPHGWVDVPELQQRLKRPTTYQEIKTVVETNDKQRFVLDASSIPPRIRAAQGHSVEIEQPLLETMTDPTGIPYAVHVTSEEGWIGIQSSGYLERRSRTHVHFATMKSHIRRNRWATCLLRLDLEAAMADGISFFLSSNHVLLSELPIPVKFLTRVEEADFPQDW